MGIHIQHVEVRRRSPRRHAVDHDTAFHARGHGGRERLREQSGRATRRSSRGLNRQAPRRSGLHECRGLRARVRHVAHARERAAHENRAARRRARAIGGAELELIRSFHPRMQHVAPAGNGIGDRDDALRFFRHERPDGGELIFRAHAPRVVAKVTHGVRARDAIAIRERSDHLGSAHAGIGRALHHFGLRLERNAQRLCRACRAARRGRRRDVVAAKGHGGDRDEPQRHRDCQCHRVSGHVHTP